MQIRNLVRLPTPFASLLSWIGSVTLATALFWLLFGSFVLGGCLDASPPGPPEPQARVLAAWDPLACGDPHRVVVELEDFDGRRISQSVPCDIGAMTIDVLHWGVYRGRIYAWMLAEGSAAVIRSEQPVQLEIDAPIVEWVVETPR